jgi:hypothetical protein
MSHFQSRMSMMSICELCKLASSVEETEWLRIVTTFFSINLFCHICCVRSTTLSNPSLKFHVLWNSSMLLVLNLDCTFTFVVDCVYM